MDTQSSAGREEDKPLEPIAGRCEGVLDRHASSEGVAGDDVVALDLRLHERCKETLQLGDGIERRASGSESTREVDRVASPTWSRID